MRFIAAALLMAASVLPVTAQAHKVVVVSIDGFRGVEMASLPNPKWKLPNLNQVVAGGAVSEGMLSVLPSITYPNHTSMMTGVSPATHGILSNFMFDPEHRLTPADSWVEYAALTHVPALWDIAHAAGLKTASVYWPVTVGAQIDANLPEHYPMETPRDRLLYQALSTPGLLAQYEKAYGPLPLGAAFDDHVREQMAEFLIKSQKPDLLLVHFIGLDHAEHLSGPDCPDAIHALEDIDSYIGLLRKAVVDTGAEKTTDFVIVSDHGFFSINQSFHPNAVLASLGLLGSKEHPDQWRVASFGGGGSFGLVVHNPNDHEAIDLASKTFRDLQKEGSWGIETILDQTELKAAQGYSNSFLGVGMKSNFMADGGDSGPWLTASLMKGMHGYVPGPKEMDAAFAVYGPGVEPQRLSRGHIYDVAPTIAALLGLQMPKGEGANAFASGEQGKAK